MSSFFAAIQNWFSAGFHGRHLGLILQELGKLQPEALTSFVSEACGLPKRKLKRARFEAEVSFYGRKGWRSADLGIYVGDDEEPTVLVEIKYFDKPLPETATKPAQLDDYLWWKNGGEHRHVLILSREIFQTTGVVLRRWDALARHLRPYGGRSDLIKMLVEYLEQEGIVMQNVNGYALMRYFKRLLCHSRNSGVLANNIEGPAEFTRLMKNLRLMSGTFDGRFKQAWSSAGIDVGKEGSTKVATIDFTLRHSLKQVKGNQSHVDDVGELRSEIRDGGYIDVFASHSLGSGAARWLRVTYGMFFVVSQNNQKINPPTVYLYSRAHGHVISRGDLNLYNDRKIQYAWVTDDAEKSITRVGDHLHSLVQKTIAELIDAKLTLQPQQKKALILLHRSLRESEVPVLDAA